MTKELKQAAQQATPEPVTYADMGTWLWTKLADYCRRKGLNPHHENDLFNLAGELRAMLASTSPQVPEDTARLDWIERPFVLVTPQGLDYVGLHKDEADCWQVALAWPSDDEIAARKAEGYAVYPATLTWQAGAARKGE